MFESAGLILILVVVLCIRYFVWRDRLAKIKQQLSALSSQLNRLESQIESVAARNVAQAATSPRELALTAPPASVAPAGQWSAAPTLTAAMAELVDTDAVQTPEFALDSVGADTVTKRVEPALPMQGQPPTSPAQLPTSTAATTHAEQVAHFSLDRYDRKLRHLSDVTDDGATKASTAVTTPSLFADLGQRIRTVIDRAGGSGELEALIGGSWLNKIGVVALVIGMALLARYTLQYVGPAGKVALWAGVSVALILGGVWLEKRQRYMLFARPLIGGGWALLYFTAYASYNFEPAKLINDPLVGLAVLLVVAAGMIAHSLHYRSEVVTGIAYVLGFVAIGINPVSLYSLIASGLLGASLIGLLWRLAWYRLTLAGVVATYLTYLLGTLVYSSSAAVSALTFWVSQGTLLFYWLIFASADFLRQPATENEKRLALGTTAINAGAFVALSWILVRHAYPGELYLFAGLAAAGYAGVSAILASRAQQHISHVLYGGLAGALAAAAVLLAILVWSAPGEWLAIGWEILAAVLLSIGLMRREPIFRAEGYLLVVAASLAALLLNLLNLPVGELVADGDARIRWFTVILFSGGLFAGEWTLFRSGDRLLPRESEIGPIFGHIAVGLYAVLMGRDTGAPYLGLVSLATAIVLFEFGLRAAYAPMRYRAYALMALALGAFVFNNANILVASRVSLEPPCRWMVMAAGAVGFYYLSWRLNHAASQVVRWEASAYPWLAHAGALILGAIIWNEFPPATVAIGWGLLALIIYETGVRWPEITLRIEGYALAILAWGRLFLSDFVEIGSIGTIGTRVLTVIPVAALLYYLRETMPNDGARYQSIRVEANLPIFFSFAASIALVVLARFELGRSDAVIAWAALSFALLAVGVWTKAWDYRAQAYLVALAAFLRSWTTNFALNGDFFGVPERIATTVPVIVGLFAVGLLWSKPRAVLAASAPPSLWGPIRWLDRNSTQLFSVFGAGLLAALLYYSVAGNVLTIAWAAEGLALTATGFLFRERVLRLSGLALLAFCLVKGFVIDLQGVDPIYRIISFIVLGMILVGISFVYTKYRHLIRPYI